MARPLHRPHGGDTTLRSYDPRLRLSPLVENLLTRPMLRHKPLRRHFRRPSSLFPLHLLKQSLRNEPPLYRRRYTPETNHAHSPSPLG